MWLDQEIFPNIVEITRYDYPVCTLAYPYSSRNAVTDAAVAPYFRTLPKERFTITSISGLEMADTEQIRASKTRLYVSKLKNHGSGIKALTRLQSALIGTVIRNGIDFQSPC